MKRIVGFSGGIDSQACALWVRRRFPAEEIVLLNSDVGGNEIPVTREFIAEYSCVVFPVQIVTPLVRDWLEHYGTPGTAHHDDAAIFDPESELTMERLAVIKGSFPFSGMRMCTEYLKNYPQRRWMRENIPEGIAFERYSGVRRDESKGRANARFSEFDSFFDCDLHCPLADWTKAMCFEYVRAAGEDTNPLYKMGMSRVGCSTCVNSGKDEIRNWAARFPEEVDRVRAMELRTGLPYFRFKVHGQDAFVDDVVTWSKTSRGGKQLTLPLVEAAAERGECSSKYGLCE